MIWLDFFAQAFVNALAWCLAIAVTLGAVGAVAWVVVMTRDLGGRR